MAVRVEVTAGAFFWSGRNEENPQGNFLVLMSRFGQGWSLQHISPSRHDHVPRAIHRLDGAITGTGCAVCLTSPCWRTLAYPNFR